MKRLDCKHCKTRMKATGTATGHLGGKITHRYWCPNCHRYDEIPQKS